MCDFTTGIKLCSCGKEKIKFRAASIYEKIDGEFVEKENKKNAKIPLEYIWTLFKFEGEIEITQMGRCIPPSNDIGKGLNAEWIALNLNDKNCFDFEYQAKEGDNLKIHQNVVLSPYLSFIYRNNEWTIDHHSPWSVEISEINQGRIKSLEK